MKKYIQKLAFIVFSIALILSCSKDDAETASIEQNGAQIFRSQIVTLDLDNVTLSANEYQGMLGSQSIVLQKADDNRLLFTVASSTPLGFVDLVIPALNNAVIHYEVKNTELTTSVTSTMTPFFDKLEAVVLDNPIDDAALQSSIISFQAVYDNLTTEEKTELATIYKANSTLINDILANDFSSFANRNSSSGVVTSIALHKAAVLGIAAGAILFEFGGNPGVKSLGAVIAGVSTGYAAKYFVQVIQNTFIRLGLVADDIIGTNDRSVQSTFITFENDVQKTINLNTKNRKLIANDAGNPQSDIATFFKYHNRFNYIVGAINDKITWVNNNVVFANFSLINLEIMPTTSTESDATANSLDFSKITFSVNHPYLELVNSSLQSDGQVNLKIKFAGTPTALPVESFLNYSYSDEFSSFSGKLPIEVAAVPAQEEVVIGTQIWTSRNLDVSTYRNGDTIPQVQDPNEWAALTTGAWCYYQNNTSNGSVYGKLYNWYAVNDLRGLAPNGYHVASNAEWDTLTAFLGGHTVAGGKLKATGTNWQSPNTDATNETGFTALPGGWRVNEGTFNFIGDFGNWWKSSERDTTQAYYTLLYYYNPAIGSTYIDKNYGLPVRCIKD